MCVCSTDPFFFLLPSFFFSIYPHLPIQSGEISAAERAVDRGAGFVVVVVVPVVAGFDHDTADTIQLAATTHTATAAASSGKRTKAENCQHPLPDHMSANERVALSLSLSPP